jgi:peptide methionine sulfoxide reductase MsrB
VNANIDEEEPVRKFGKDPAVISSLSPEQYRVTQQGATEMPGTGVQLDNDEPGIYGDIVSGEPLFASSAKLIRVAVGQVSQADRACKRQ